MSDFVLWRRKKKKGGAIDQETGGVTCARFSGEVGEEANANISESEHVTLLDAKYLTLKVCVDGIKSSTTVKS